MTQDMTTVCRLNLRTEEVLANDIAIGGCPLLLHVFLFFIYDAHPKLTGSLT